MLTDCTVNPSEGQLWWVSLPKSLCWSQTKIHKYLPQGLSLYLQGWWYWDHLVSSPKFWFLAWFSSFSLAGKVKSQITKVSTQSKPRQRNTKKLNRTSATACQNCLFSFIAWTESKLFFFTFCRILKFNFKLLILNCFENLLYAQRCGKHTKKQARLPIIIKLNHTNAQSSSSFLHWKGWTTTQSRKLLNRVRQTILFGRRDGSRFSFILKAIFWFKLPTIALYKIYPIHCKTASITMSGEYAY